MGKESPAVYSTFVINLINWLTGRKFITNMRYAQLISPRFEAPPNLPPGPHDKLSDNYYYLRDARREVDPPIITYIGHSNYQQKQLPTNFNSPNENPKKSILPDQFLKQLNSIKPEDMRQITPSLGHKF